MLILVQAFKIIKDSSTHIPESLWYPNRLILADFCKKKLRLSSSKIRDRAPAIPFSPPEKGIFGSFIKCPQDMSVSSGTRLHSVILDIHHFFRYILSAKPKRSGYMCNIQEKFGMNWLLAQLLNSSSPLNSYLRSCTINNDLYIICSLNYSSFLLKFTVLYIKSIKWIFLIRF